MSEEPQDNWKRPRVGKRKWLAWFALFAAVLFVTICTVSLLSNNRGDVGELILFALLIAVTGSAFVLLAIYFVRWLCCWRNFRRFLFATACLVTLIALVWAEENWRGKRAWQNHEQELKARGERLNIAELAPPSVPDAENFAMTPLLRPMLDFTRGQEGGIWNDTNGLARLEKISADLPSVRSRLALGSLEKNTFADLVTWAEFYRGNKNYPQPPAPRTAAEDIQFALAKFDPEFKELREAAARPYSRFPIEYDHEPAGGILLPHLARLKVLVVLTHVRATAELEARHSQDAFADLKLGLRISDSISNEPILIDHLVRIATVAINLQTIREGLIRHAWNDGQLVELENYLASLSLLAEYKLGMRGERALGTAGLDWMRRQGFGPDGMRYLSNDDGASGSSGDLGHMPAGWFYQNMLTISQMHQDFTLAAVDEKLHRVFPDLCEKLDARLEQMSVGPYNIFARMLMPALSKAPRKSARMQTFVDAARIACALERHRIANGALPESLNVLKPRFIERIPNDVIDGKPLRYRRDADGGYVLYSIGWNKADDGGEIVLAKGTDPGIDLTKGDWAWKMPVK